RLQRVAMRRARAGKGKIAAPPDGADQAQKEQQGLLDRNLAPALVDEIEALRRAVEDDAEIPYDSGNEPLDLTDRLAEQMRPFVRSIRREAVRRHGLDAERSE